SSAWPFTTWSASGTWLRPRDERKSAGTCSVHRGAAPSGAVPRPSPHLGTSKSVPFTPFFCILLESMTTAINTDLIERVTPLVRDLVVARTRPHLRYADIRLEIVEGKYATAENGDAKGAGEDATMSFGVRVLAGDAMVAPGYFGRGLGEADLPDLERVLAHGLEAAYRRALANAEWKAESRGKFGPLGAALADTRLHPVRACRDTVPAAYEIDPRTLDLGQMTRFTRGTPRQIANPQPSTGYNYVSTLTQLARELFASSEGALIDQAFALTQGLCYVVANGDGNSQEIYDVLGHQ